MMPDRDRSNQSLLIRLLSAGVVLAILALGILLFHQVPSAITAEDELAITNVLDLDMRAVERADFQTELGIIGRVQRAVLNITPVYYPIPKGQKREPADLIEAGHGYCFDRARSIEKALRYNGFETRYAALYSINQTGSAFKAITRKGGSDVRSHAVVEVLTSRGWLVVDTIHPWLALDEENNPLSLADLKDGKRAASLAGDIYFLYKMPFTYVYGLYSRHGRSYPPYNFIPDVNWQEMRYNFF